MARKFVVEHVGHDVVFVPETPSVEAPSVPQVSEKQRLLDLHRQLKELGVNRISQLENLIARAE